MNVIWTRIFTRKMRKDFDFDTPLTISELCDPENNVVCNLLYIYSMETFIAYVINSISRNHEYPKIEKLGPMGQALKYILKGAE